MQMAVSLAPPLTDAAAERPGATDQGTVLVVASLPDDAALLNALVRSTGELAINLLPSELAPLLSDDIHCVLLAEDALQAGCAETLAAWAGAQPDWSALPVLMLMEDTGNIAPRLADRIEHAPGLQSVLLPRSTLAAFGRSALQTAVAVRRRQYRVRERLAELQAENDRVRLLGHEVQHRARNTLTKLSAILDLTWRRAPSPEDFIESFGRRLEVMARGLDLLSLEEAHRGASLRDLVEAEVGASIGGPPGKTLLTKGGQFGLRERAALAMHLVVHELATNAMKYGGLSRPNGRVVVQWGLESDANGLHLAVEWREQNGPVVCAPEKGFGALLIERSLAECGGTATLTFAPEGVRCAMRIPFEALANDSSAQEIPR